MPKSQNCQTNLRRRTKDIIILEKLNQLSGARMVRNGYTFQNSRRKTIKTPDTLRRMPEITDLIKGNGHLNIKGGKWCRTGKGVLARCGVLLIGLKA